MTTALVARLDSAGDVLITGPAVRAVAAGHDRVVFLAGSRGNEAARLLPGVDRVVQWTAAWVDFDALTAEDAGDAALNLGGHTTLEELASVYAGAQAVVAPNTGPAHLAAAVGTPIVSLFAPVVPAEQWAAYGTNVVVLGGQQAPCRLTRARHCPVPGHPCLDGIAAQDVVPTVADVQSRGAA